MSEHEEALEMLRKKRDVYEKEIEAVAARRANSLKNAEAALLQMEIQQKCLFDINRSISTLENSGSEKMRDPSMGPPNPPNPPGNRPFG